VWSHQSCWYKSDLRRRCSGRIISSFLILLVCGSFLIMIYQAIYCQLSTVGTSSIVNNLVYVINTKHYANTYFVSSFRFRVASALLELASRGNAEMHVELSVECELVCVGSQFFHRQLLLVNKYWLEEVAG
jgi:hypothetical protein